MGILGGSLFGVAQADFQFLGATSAAFGRVTLSAGIITTGLIKSVMFGITITAVGCLGKGCRPVGGAEQVGPIHHSGPWSCPSSGCRSGLVLYGSVLFRGAIDDHRPNTSRALNQNP